MGRSWFDTRSRRGRSLEVEVKPWGRARGCSRALGPGVVRTIGCSCSNIGTSSGGSIKVKLQGIGKGMWREQPPHFARSGSNSVQHALEQSLSSPGARVRFGEWQRLCLLPVLAGEGKDIELKHQRSPDVVFDCVRATPGEGDG